MASFQAKINEAGRVLIPLSLRRELGLQAEDDVFLRIENNELILTPLKISIAHIQSKVKQRNIHHKQLSLMLQTGEKA